jgi:RES domain-containing protein
MRVWRISNYADLRGLGGLRSGARWHSAGRRIVYASDHPAAALLEKLVHFEFESADDLPTTYRLLEIEVPETLAANRLPAGALPNNWREHEHVTRKIGDMWLRDGSSAVLVVPSAVTPHACNYLINPHHTDAGKIRIASRARHPFDVRRFKIISNKD